MSAIETPEHERPLWEAVKKHEDLKAMVADLGKRKLVIQHRLSQMSHKAPERAGVVRDMQQLESTLIMLKQQCAAAGIERNRADQALLRVRAVAAGVRLSALPATGSPPQPSLSLNAAQVKHLRLLAVRIRSDELKAAARLEAARDFAAIVLPFLREES